MGARPLGNCRRCFEPRRAVTTIRFTIPSGTYDLACCDPCADRFTRDMSMWARLATIVDDDPRPRSDDIGTVMAGYVHVPVRVAPAPEPEPVPEPRINRGDGLPPGHEEWTFKTHALDRSVQRKISRADALWCAMRPDVIRPGDKPDLKVHVRGGIHVVVAPARKLIITVAKANVKESAHAAAS